MTGSAIGAIDRACIGCGRPLSIHNNGVKCSACEGAPNGRSRPPEIIRCRMCPEPAAHETIGIVSGRFRNLCEEHHDQEQDVAINEALQRPTTDGGIQLPPPVPGRERTYEEMIGRAGETEAPPATCAECGREMPASQAGWLCSKCQVGAIVGDAQAPTAPAAKPKRKPKHVYTTPSAERCRRRGCDNPATPQSLLNSKRGRWYKICEKHKRDELDASAAKYAAKAKPRRPPRAPRERRPRGRQVGTQRRFDHAAALSVYLEHRNYAEVARQMETTPKSARFAVRNEAARQGIDLPLPAKRAGNAPARATPAAPVSPALRIYAERMRDLADVSRRLGEIASGISDLTAERAPLLQRWADLTLLLQQTPPPYETETLT